MSTQHLSLESHSKVEIALHITVGLAVAALVSYVVSRFLWSTDLPKSFRNGAIIDTAVVVSLNIACIVVGWLIRKRRKYVAIGIAAYGAAYLVIVLAGFVLWFITRLTV